MSTAVTSRALYTCRQKSPAAPKELMYSMLTIYYCCYTDGKYISYQISDDLIIKYSIPFIC